ncbi:MAG TPA: amino acid adenylation domain-containing protein [Pyrinomonadaceae bacterium]
MSNLSERIAGLSVEKRELLARLMKERGGHVAPARESIPRREETGSPAPLSFAQERLWFLHQLEPENAVYNAPIAIRLRGSLNVGALESSLTELVRRHAILRTTFGMSGGESVQEIAAPRALQIPLTDLSHLPPAERTRQTVRLMAEKSFEPFDLRCGPLLRAALLRLDEDEHIALFAMHHIVFDGWSLAIFVGELTTLYSAYATGKVSAPGELPIQYADFARWQRAQLQGETFDRLLSFWKQQLGGQLPVLQLPFDRPRPAVQTFAGARKTIRLSKRLTESLKELSRREGVTLFMTLLAIFKTLLYRYTGQSDLLVGTPIANRLRPELEGLIGFFVNTLVMRAELAGDQTFLELLRQVRAVALQAYEHQDMPFEQLVQALQPERNLSHSPLFQVMFTFQESLEVWRLPELEVELLDPPDKLSKFDLTLDVTVTDDELQLTVEYNTDLFEHETASRMLNHFQALATGVAATPERTLSQLPLLSADERELILVELNRTQMPYAFDRCAHQIFEELVERQPDKVALICGDETLTYGELNRRSNRLAHYLRRLGVGPEVVVGICVDSSAEMAVGILGTLKAGGAYLPLDASYPIERLAFMMEDARLPILLTQERLLDSLPSRLHQIVCLDTDGEKLAGEAEHNPVNLTRPDNLAYMIYTSGSTARPKGVQLGHQGLCNLAAAQVQAFGIGQGSRVLQFSSFSFDASVWETVMALLTGATLCMARRETDFLDGENLLQILREQAITIATLPPSVLSALPVTALPDLQTLISAGESCSSEIVARWSPGRSFFNAYGPTESTVCASLRKCEASDERRAPSIGRPIANMEIYILDRRGNPVPVGVPGELYIGGAGLARGYHNRPALTAEKFVPHPFSREPGARLYRTGDLVRYLPEGDIEFLGRMDFQVKVRGFRIELEEIESVLNGHPSVRQNVVVTREDTPGEKRLIAYVVTDGQPLTVEQLRGYLKEKLPAYMIPSVFLVLKNFPLTPSGKIDRKALPAPDGSRLQLAAEFVGPQTDIERELSAIWQEALRVERVGTHDNFFDLGGHSLLMLKVHGRLQARLDRELSLMSLFKYPTVSALARYLSDEEDEPPAVRQSLDRAQKQRAALERQKQLARRKKQA